MARHQHDGATPLIHTQSQHRSGPTTSKPSQILIAVVTCGLLFVLSMGYHLMSDTNMDSPSSITQYNLGKYTGPGWQTTSTLSIDRLVETPFGSCEIHKVRLPNGKIAHDWLWFNEFDQVNIVVRNTAGSLIFFRLLKYGIEAESLAPVGGLMDRPGEIALDAAKRELIEELNMVASKWIPLHKYVGSCNRGGGHLNAFLALDALPNPGKSMHSDDLEAHTIVEMNKLQVKQALLDGNFKETKWALSVSLALLWLDSNGLN